MVARTSGNYFKPVTKFVPRNDKLAHRPFPQAASQAKSLVPQWARLSSSLPTEGFQMKVLKRSACLLLLCLPLSCGGPNPLEGPGNLFIREKAGNLKAFKEALLAQAPKLKGR